MYTPCIDDFIVKIYIRDNNSMLAQAEVKIGPLKMIGFRIMKNKAEFEGDNIYVAEPKIKLGEKYLSIVFLEDKGLWVALQNKIKETYREELDNQTSEKGVIDPSEIDVDINKSY